MHDNNTTEIDTEGMGRAAKAVREFGEAWKSLKEYQEKANRYHVKAWPWMEIDRYHEATMRRARKLD